MHAYMNLFKLFIKKKLLPKRMLDLINSIFELILIKCLFDQIRLLINVLTANHYFL